MCRPQICILKAWLAEEKGTPLFSEPAARYNRVRSPLYRVVTRCRAYKKKSSAPIFYGVRQIRSDVMPIWGETKVSYNSLSACLKKSLDFSLKNTISHIVRSLIDIFSKHDWLKRNQTPHFLSQIRSVSNMLACWWWFLWLTSSNQDVLHLWQ